jgi:hypothetical protein
MDITTELVESIKAVESVASDGMTAWGKET